MMRRLFPALRLGATAVLLGSLGLAPATAAAPQAAGQARDPAELIKGKWQATVGGRPFILDLRLDDGELVGTIQLPSRKSVPIEDGLFVVDEFSFTTVEDDIEWEWTGTITEAGLEGERERFDNDTTETFTAQRQP